MAGAVISALKDSGKDKEHWPAVTGGGAELHAIQAIHKGMQYSTEFTDPRALGEAAAAAVDALFEKKELKTMESAQFDNGISLVPAYIVPTQTVVADNLQKVIIDSGYWSKNDVES